MSTLTRTRSRFSLGIFVLALLPLLLSLQGCGSRSAYSTTVDQMLSSGDSGKRVLRVAGTISTEPTQTGTGTVFLIADEADPSRQVAVVYDKTALPVVKPVEGHSGYTGRLMIATGTFDGRVLATDELIVKTYGSYGTP